MFLFNLFYFSTLLHANTFVNEEIIQLASYIETNTVTKIISKNTKFSEIEYFTNIYAYNIGY